MKQNNFLTPKILLPLLLAIGTLLRCYNLNWDNGFYLHPDERLFVNASNLSLPSSWQQFFSPLSPLNPHMFYYGSFLLYLYKAVHDLFFPTTSFLLVSRGISALFSSITILILFLFTKRLFPLKVALLSTFVFVFTIGSIQYAHFNTTESALNLLVVLIAYFSLRLVQTKRLALLPLVGVLSGISFATKVTGLIFILFPLLSFSYLFVSLKQKKVVWGWGILTFILAILSAFISAPYQLIDRQDFLLQTSYMTEVTYGTFKPPFVIIYQNTIPYLYQILHIFPFIMGFISFPFSVIGLVLLIRLLIKKKDFLLLFLLLFPLLYFLWSGAWYGKYERYYILLLPFFSIWSGYALSKMKKIVLFIFLCLIAFNGLLYLQIYTQVNTRVAASNWIYQNLPNNSTLTSEYWDDSLPLPVEDTQGKKFTTITLNLYDTDSKGKIETLAVKLSQANYIILSSRRVIASIQKNKSLYPKTTRYYQDLFSGQLGFSKVKEFSMYPFYFSDNYADETFQSYDHPPVVIFKNIKHLSKEALFTLLWNS